MLPRVSLQRPPACGCIHTCVRLHIDVYTYVYIFRHLSVLCCHEPLACTDIYTRISVCISTYANDNARIASCLIFPVMTCLLALTYTCKRVCILICTHVCIYAHLYIRTYTYRHASCTSCPLLSWTLCQHTYTQTCSRVHVDTCMYVYWYIYACVYVLMHMGTCVYWYTYTHVCACVYWFICTDVCWHTPLCMQILHTFIPNLHACLFTRINSYTYIYRQILINISSCI